MPNNEWIKFMQKQNKILNECNMKCNGRGCRMKFIGELWREKKQVINEIVNLNDDLIKDIEELHKKKKEK